MLKINKTFFKVGMAFALIIVGYVLFIIFVLSPRITSYLVDLEIKQAKDQIDKISTIIDSKGEYLEGYKSLKLVKHRENIRNISHVAYSVMNNYYKMFKEGYISREKALEYSFDSISKLKYGHNDDYLFILDSMGNLAYHPNKKLHKKNMINIKDEKGNFFVEEIINNSIKEKETYTQYFWSKLNSDIISEKIVHSLYFEPFDLIISSGVYIKNIESELEIEKEKMMTYLKPLINSIILDRTGYIFIVNSNNQVVIHPNKELVDVDISSLKHPLTNKSLMHEIHEAYKNDKAWKYTWNRLDDIDNYTYKKIAWVRYNPLFDWYIISSIYEDDIKSKAKDINEMVLYISFLILMILSMIAIFFIKKLLQPISILSKNADLVKNGNLSIRNNIQRDDELGSLSKHFDRMLDSIEDNTKSLEYKIETRTAELKHKLYYDELTGLKNRHSLLKDIKKEEYCALNLLEIEGFDDINELYGFSVANEILIEVMKMLKAFCKEQNISLYRLETGNFVIIDNRIDKFASYDNFLEEILAIFKKEVHIMSLDIEIFTYVTIGTSISQQDSLKSANIALKRAKQNGVRFLVYNKSIDTRDNIKKSMYWREKIKEAIDEDRVVPFFQAIYDKNKKVIKYETLMRIYDEVDGRPYYLSPGTFFEVAIKTKQYFKLNQIVIKKALDNIDKIDKDISINISFADVMNRGFSQFIEEEIDNLSKEQRKKVVFEILESDHISDYGILDDFILKYRKKGIRIAIDDFGTGYSNFSHILKVKPDYIKIDGSLIENINKDANSYEMVKAIIDFSKALNIIIIAEFIHSQEVFDKVKELGADEFQGYFLGEPELLI